jgi:hypothetical protein
MWGSKQIALIIVFTALAIILTPIRIPSIILIGVFFRFSEIPIVAAFLLFGPKIGISIAVLNIGAEMMVIPGPTALISPFFVLLLTISMLLGIHTALLILNRKESQNNRNGKKLGTYIIAIGTLFRTAPAPFLIGFLYRFIIPPVTGINLTNSIVIGLMPVFALYALVFSLYTIPIGYFIARTLGQNLKITDQYYKRFTN